MLGSHAVVDANSHLLKVRAMPPTVKVIGVVIGGRAFERQMKADYRRSKLDHHRPGSQVTLTALPASPLA
jgi:hypothetical protein